MKFADYTPELIQELSTGEETILYRKSFSDDEMIVYRETLSDKVIDLDELEDDLKKIKKEYKAKMDEIKSELKEIKKYIRNGYTEENREVYKVPDFETQTMNFFCKETGQILDFRKLKPDEKQLSILSPISKVS